MQSKIQAALLFAQYTTELSYYDDWIDAFQQSEVLDVHLVNAADARNHRKGILKKIENSEFVILHHSMTGDTLKYLEPFKKMLLNRKGRLLSFVGNEVNLPSIGVKEKIAFLKKLEPEFIGTQLLQEAGAWLYNACSNSCVISLPHALNPNSFKPVTAFRERSIDIGTRSARYGVYLGDPDRNSIISFFNELARKKDLKVDLGINENHRFNRTGWTQFLNQCKATISTEAGSFYLEKDDQLVNRIVSYLGKETQSFILPNESSWARKTYQKILPNFLRAIIRKSFAKRLIEKDRLGENDNFSEIWEKFFKNKDKAPVYSKCISSRHFDAVGTKTLQIMFPGRFNDILMPGVHYAVLNRDFSNIDVILATIFDQKKSENITSAAYSYVMNHHTYQHRVKEILNFL